MPSRRVAADLNSGTYYLTMTIQRWYYLFDRHNRWQILADSLRYCQEHKGLELNGYVFMLNHIHLIATCPDVSGFLRDFFRAGRGMYPVPTFRDTYRYCKRDGAFAPFAGFGDTTRFNVCVCHSSTEKTLRTGFSSRPAYKFRAFRGNGAGRGMHP